ncbi:MAG: hypothetical protein F4X57_11225 [Chloroflexi bacterium]|nr:hypothetical protein [Chloroflexota bacterium]
MAEFDLNYTARFYNAYGDLEWERLEATPYGRLQATIHADFIIDSTTSRTCDRLSASISAFDSANTALPMFRLYSLSKLNWYNWCLSYRRTSAHG